jgi:predicted TIM-barrel fold metal-dependent hydrolase
MGNWTWTTEDFRPYVETAIAAFGVERCMFASNFPVDKLFSDYDLLFRSFSIITADCPREDRLALFHDNAACFYRL